MQRADDFVAFDLAEDRQISLAVRAIALKREVAERDFFGRFIGDTESTSCFALSPRDALDREAL